jgi:hypothetical protein
MDNNSRKAFEELKDLSSLALTDIERAMSGPLTHAAVLAIRHWLARAFEVGETYGKVKNNPGFMDTVPAPKNEEEG